MSIFDLNTYILPNFVLANAGGSNVYVCLFVHLNIDVLLANSAPGTCRALLHVYFFLPKHLFACESA